MTSRVLPSRALRIGVAGMLLATLVSGTTLAKNPANNLSGTATAIPGTVSAGALVRFNYSVTNTSNSNFTSDGSVRATRRSSGRLPSGSGSNSKP